MDPADGRGEGAMVGAVGRELRTPAAAGVAGIAFLWFVAAIRNRIGAYEDRFFATVFLGSGMIVTSTIGLRTHVLPRRLVFLGYAIALVLLFSVSYVKGFIFSFPAWVTAVSIEILARARSQRFAQPARPMC